MNHANLSPRSQDFHDDDTRQNKINALVKTVLGIIKTSPGPQLGAQTFSPPHDVLNDAERKGREREREREKGKREDWERGKERDREIER